MRCYRNGQISAVISVLLTGLLLGACSAVAALPSTAIPQPSTAPVTATRILSATLPFTPTLTPSPTPIPPTPTQTLTPSLTPTIEPAGCKKPGDDYSTMEVNGWTLDRRTYEMLEYAATLYQGELDIAGYAVTQGSYHDNGAASFGTHLGGGAVDLSVMRAGTWTVLYDDIEPLVNALRLAGFAAWFRDFDELYPGSAVHIHAIAIGDQQLSQAAIDQLTGTYGYFRGYSGVPQANGTPVPDRHGGPVICQWMRDLGYTDLREP